jgi:hypothetical protein
MCHVSTNGIHIVTNHAVHFFYYGFGFLALSFFWWTPDTAWLVPTYALWQLGCFTFFRFYALPGYPEPWNIYKLYRLDSSGAWKLGSTPGTKSELGGYPLTSMHAWALPFPMYEIFNTHLSSGCAQGIVVALITCNAMESMNLAPKISVQSLAASIGGAVVFALIVELLPGSEAELHHSVLTRSCPTLTRMFAAACGAGMLPMQLNWQKHDPTVPVVIQIVGFSALGISLVATYLAGVVALCSHTRGGDADKTTAQAAWEAGGGAALRAARDNPAT